jgi:hypothetical protein
MSELPQPVTTDHLYMAAILIQLQKISNSLDGVTNALQQLNNAAMQKQPIQVQLDAMRLSEAIEDAHDKRMKKPIKTVRT